MLRLPALARPLAAAFVALIFAAAPAQAQTFTWTGGGADSNWLTAGNWSASSGSPPPANDLTNTFLVFTGNTQLANNQNYSFSANSLTFDAGAGAFVISGNETLTLGTGGITVLGTNDQIFNSNLALGAAGTWANDGTGTFTVGGTVNNGGFLLTVGGSGNSTYNGVISGAGGLTKTGAGTVTLGAANTYTGVTTISAGSLAVTDDAALGATGMGNETMVSSGASLHVSGGRIITEALTLNGTGISNGGALRSTSGDNSYRGGIALGAGGARINSDSGTLTITTLPITGSGEPLTIGGAGNVLIGGGFAGLIGTVNGALIKDGSGTLTVANTNTWTGAITINAGVLSIPLSTTLGTAGLVTIDGGTLRNTNTGNGGSFISATRGISVGPNGGTVEFVTAASTNASIYAGTITGTGTLTKIGNGEFRYQGTGLPNTTYTKLVVNDGLFRLGFASSTQDERGFGAVPTSPLADAITLNGGGIGTSFNISLHVNRGITLGAGGGFFNNSGGQLTVPGVITGSGALNKNSTGTLVLSGANDYTGATNITAGTLSAGAANTLPSTTAVTVSGGTLALGANSQIIGSLAGTSNVTRTTADLITGGNNSSTAYSGIIDGSGTVTKSGSGTWTLGGANTYTGATTINAGRLAIGTGGSLAAGSAVTVNTTGTLEGAGTVGGSVTLNGGTISGGVNGVGTLTVGGDVTFNANARQDFRITAAGTPAAANTGGSSTGTNNNAVNVQGALLITNPADIPTFHFTVDGTGATFTSGQTYSYVVGTIANNTLLGAFTLTDQSQFTAVGFSEPVLFSLTATGTTNTPLILNIAPVPEPVTVLGLAAGVLGVGGLIRRRKSRAV